MASDNNISDKLKGTWIETMQNKDYPGIILEFKENKIYIQNMYSEAITEEYTVTDRNNDDFTISFEHKYKQKRGNGRIVEYCDRPEFIFHEENGRPILSQTVIEYDGRGLIIINEFLRKEDYTNDFKSELKHRLNDRTATSMMAP